LTTASWNGIPVYQLHHFRAKTTIMRRQSDNWINATHILKTGQIARATRLRILEKEVHTGVHEKVQGGYGKYQGTW
ncbi:transcription regulator HTH, apses-type DNA-binding domain-containing protein, partial [Powellomyces hirtus]